MLRAEDTAPTGFRSPMPIRFSSSLLLLTTVVAGLGLSGCASVNQTLIGASDYVPQWAGGLPADAPPRPGTAKYDAYMAERERLRKLPADQRPKDAQSETSGAGAAPPSFIQTH
jgi:uncharacterized protein YceK